MSNIKEATHTFKGDYYKVGMHHYAEYFNRIWRVSASVTNEKLLLEGEKLNDR